jgi:DNA-3-methyladenine glycosylase II
MLDSPVFTLRIPNTYCFSEAMKAIQRGKNDPINLVRESELIRLINLDEKNILIGVSKTEDLLKIRIFNEILSSDISTELSIMITKLFGLDDPLLDNSSDFDFPYDQNLNSLVTVHGYLSVFEAAIQTIIGQLISANVANLLREKFIRKFGGYILYNNEKYFSFPTPSAIKCLSTEQIQEIGISKLKSKAILNIANEFTKNNLESVLTGIEDPKKIKEILTNLYGIGRWTSDWISLRALRRFAIVPSGDLIIRKAFSWHFNHSYLLSSNEVDSIAQSFYPYGGALAYRIMYAYIKSLK